MSCAKLYVTAASALSGRQHERRGAKEGTVTQLVDERLANVGARRPSARGQPLRQAVAPSRTIEDDRRSERRTRISTARRAEA